MVEYSGYAVDYVKDRELFDNAIAKPRAFLKRVWEYLETAPLNRSVRVLSLWTIAMALITLIHSKDK